MGGVLSGNTPSTQPQKSLSCPVLGILLGSLFVGVCGGAFGISMPG